MEKEPFTVTIPKNDCHIEQGEEQFVIEYNGEKKCVRAHDYDEIYRVPGLYEYLFYDKYKCDSPNVVCSELVREVKKSSMKMSELKVLDVGAGNGMVGEKLVSCGADTVVGIDIIEEAAEATKRDRPGIYNDYFIEDLTSLPQEVKGKIAECEPNCMTVVAALGFGDIPPEAFAKAYNMICDSGWIAFNIKDEFCSEMDTTGFSKLIDDISTEGLFRIKSKKRYRHRFCQDGTPLHYYAIVGQKQKSISDKLLPA
jgi:predicted TPR repeat methyltransferase